MPPLLHLQKLPGKGDIGWEKGDIGWEKVSLRRFLADLKIASSGRIFFFLNWGGGGGGVSYSTSNKLLLVARPILTTGL